ncbi:inner membrane transporter RhtA [Tsukamurella pulmonis]|uniref:Inner membrane transporter RhtA n=1 Tax=Tsukamurella pulmonis TaxID=47312 RepID=A0A1H1F4U1_9ACTN|nr:inner membrane transporter RhtA [Tsukamurella pulmonis]SUP20076.1 Inner membrane transporter rhtA [Tsukamurella pulmonis]
MRLRSHWESSSTMLVSAVSTQASSALSLQTFSRAGPAPASGLRMAGAAVMMCALTRPNLRRVTVREWSAIIAFGVVMAVMNLCLYQAIDRLPLGVAVTLDFLGPCSLAFVMAKRWRERCCAPIALLGVVLIAGQGSGVNLVGVAFGLGAGLCFAGYAVLAERVGRQQQPLSRLALAVTIAAATTAPWSLRALGELNARTVGLLLAAAFFGVVVSYTCDAIAAARASAALIALLFGLDPAVGAIVGTVFLHQSLGVPAVVGMVLVVGAGVAVSWMAATDTRRARGGEVAPATVGATSSDAAIDGVLEAR